MFQELGTDSDVFVDMFEGQGLRFVVLFGLFVVFVRSFGGHVQMGQERMRSVVS